MTGGRPTLPTAEQFEHWGIDPSWSRLVDVPGHDGTTRTWHVLDTGPPPDESLTGPRTGSPGPPATIVCVHGNPTWSGYWRSVHRQLGDRHRVIAVDQLGMGFSERTGQRRFAQRVDDLGDVIAALDVHGPVVVVAHDWGGPISLGWVLRNRERVSAVVLCNTGVAVPVGRRAPALIRLAGAGPVTELVGHRTRIFLDGTLALSGRRIGTIAREVLRAPYRRAVDRSAIAEFVADVPFAPDDPSAPAIAAVAEGIRELRMPVLLAWGAADPVFDDDFAHDLAERMAHADLQRFAGLGHLVVEETDIAGLVERWLADVLPTGGPTETAAPTAENSEAGDAGDTSEAGDPAPFVPVWAALEQHADDAEVAFVDGSTGVATTFAELHATVSAIAGGLTSRGLLAGERVAVLVEPGVDLLAVVYGCWRAGAVTVIADRGLGLRGLGRAVRGAHVDWVIGAPRALAAARLLRWAPRSRTITVGSRRSLGSIATLDELTAGGARPPAEPRPDDAAAVLFTSGATGPAKGVRYTHGQIAAQRDALRDAYAITVDDRLVAAFAPFALYGPALGIASTIPDVDVTAPGTLTAAALAEAVASIDATIVFASPAALANVVDTAAAADPRLAAVRLVLSAGAPVSVKILRSTAALCPAAELHTPYGMTECLPVADISLTDITAALAADTGVGGVCVGAPVPGVAVLIAELGFDAAETVGGVDDGATGEILVDAPWLSAGYDQLWRIEHDARPTDAAGRTWHRTGDVGHVDDAGRLWVEGRTVHVIDADGGPITPVPIEVAVEHLDGVARAAAVGVGPSGCQQLVIVLEDGAADEGLAGAAITTRVRTAIALPVSAVLCVRALPVDIRHNTKIDRTAVATWAAAVLAGGRAKRPW